MRPARVFAVSLLAFVFSALAFSLPCSPAVSKAQAADTVYATVSSGNSWESDGMQYTQYDVVIVNNGNAPISTWEIAIDLPKEAAIEQAWNFTYQISSSKLVMKPAAYATEIAAGARTSGIGFITKSSSRTALSTYSLTYKTQSGYTTAQGDGAANAKKEGVTTSAVNSNAVSSKSTYVSTSVPNKQISALHVSGTKLVNARGKAVRLQGVSTHGIAWYPQYVNYRAFKTLRDDWKANVIRLAVYTDEYGGWCTGGNRKQLRDVIERGVKYATALKMYVIIDWHTLNGASANPLKRKTAAAAFFKEMSKKYAKHTNVIYEICNEPNGATTWRQIKTYAKKIIPIIRKNAPDALIICGTPTWSQDVDKVATNKLPYKNVMYALHFYAGTHKQELRDKAQNALAAKVPLFISESSICDASGSGKIDYASANAWKRFIKQNGLSYIEWNLSNKAESSSIIRSSSNKKSSWKLRELSATGKWYRSMMRSLAKKK